MARRWVAGGETASKMGRGVAANILNKLRWTADKGWCSSLGVGRGADNFWPKNWPSHET
jgi:hypothetical protein